MKSYYNEYDKAMLTFGKLSQNATLTGAEKIQFYDGLNVIITRLERQANLEAGYSNYAGGISGRSVYNNQYINDQFWGEYAGIVFAVSEMVSIPALYARVDSVIMSSFYARTQAIVNKVQSRV